MRTERPPSTNAFFGTSVVAGDFNGDGYKDLAVGSPGQRVGGDDSAGAVTLLYGSASGIYNDVNNRTIHQDTSGVAGVADPDDRFGFALAVGDFNNDGRDDLAVSAPGESIESDNLSEVGVVHIFFGSSNGITVAGDVLLRQGVGGVAGITEEGDQFGYALTSGDFNGDGSDDLAVGIPYEDHNAAGIIDGGAVHLFYGSGSGLRTDNGRLMASRDSTAFWTIPKKGMSLGSLSHQVT